MEKDSRGIVRRQGCLIRVEDAQAEQVICPEGDSQGALLISYLERDEAERITVQKLWLDMNRDTVLLNRTGQRIHVCNIRVGAFIDAVFSARLTKSIPPRSDAFLIQTQGRMAGQTIPEQADITVDRISGVSPEEGAVYIGNPADPADQLRLIVTSGTEILDPEGKPISIGELRQGQRVRVLHAGFQTAGIPPQTTAYRIQAE